MRDTARAAQPPTDPPTGHQISLHGPKMPILGPKCQFWAKFGRFWAQNPIFWGQGVKILVPSYQDSNETPFSCWRHWSARLQLAARGENVLFWPQNLDIWGQKSIFCLVIAIFVDGANDHYTRGSNFPIGTTPKKFSVSELGVIFGAHPCFWPFWALPTLQVYLPLILVRFHRNSGELSGPSPSRAGWILSSSYHEKSKQLENINMFNCVTSALLLLLRSLSSPIFPCLPVRQLGIGVDQPNLTFFNT